MESFIYHYALAGVPPTADKVAIQKAFDELKNRLGTYRKSDQCFRPFNVLTNITSRLQHDCDVGVRIDIMERRVSHGRQLVATAAATVSELEKSVADSDKALVDLESHWSYLVGPDNASGNIHSVFQDRVDEARARRTVLEAECVLKSKRIVEYQQEIHRELAVMESTLGELKAEKRNVINPFPGTKNSDNYYRDLRKAWEDAEKRAKKLPENGGLEHHTWPVYQPLTSAEYSKELMLHLSKKIHEAGSAKEDLAKEIEKRDSQIREKDILLAEKDDQLRGKDEQIRDKDAKIREQDAHIGSIYPRIVEVDDSDELLECQLCKEKTQFARKVGRDQTLACLDCIPPV